MTGASGFGHSKRKNNRLDEYFYFGPDSKKIQKRMNSRMTKDTKEKEMPNNPTTLGYGFSGVRGIQYNKGKDVSCKKPIITHK